MLNVFVSFYPPAREASREVANLTERKNLHTPLNGVKEFVHLSVKILRKQLIYDFLAENNYPDLPPFAGGMKFKAQISPLLN